MMTTPFECDHLANSLFTQWIIHQIHVSAIWRQGCFTQVRADDTICLSANTVSSAMDGNFQETFLRLVKPCWLSPIITLSYVP